jgi:tetratricopeptide (TPR) repeat protein
MFRPCHIALVWVVFGGFVASSFAEARKPSPSGVPSPAAKAMALAQSGHCKEALPLLKQAKTAAADKDLRRSIGFAGVRCAMFAGQPEAAEQFLLSLSKEFPHDPEVLYLSVHTYSDLSSRAAAELAMKAPNSASGHELHAEALETDHKWDEAAKEYRLVLEQNPHEPGIHFRLGRLMLSKGDPTPEEAAGAQKEMQAELEIDPSNAGAEYVLGVIAKQNQQLDEAVLHFSHAAKLDSGFGDAFVGWGGSLVSQKKFSEAIPPLETGVRLQSGNPTAHYLLAMAYSRVGRKEEADREFAIQQKLTQKGAAGEPSSESQPVPN